MFKDKIRNIFNSSSPNVLIYYNENNYMKMTFCFKCGNYINNNKKYESQIKCKCDKTLT